MPKQKAQKRGWRTPGSSRREPCGACRRVLKDVRDWFEPNGFFCAACIGRGATVLMRAKAQLSYAQADLNEVGSPTGSANVAEDALQDAIRVLSNAINSIVLISKSAPRTRAKRK